MSQNDKKMMFSVLSICSVQLLQLFAQACENFAIVVYFTKKKKNLFMKYFGTVLGLIVFMYS